MFRRSNGVEFFLLRRDTYSKETAFFYKEIFMNMEIPTSCEAVNFRVTYS